MDTFAYLARRTLQALIVVLLVTVVVFGLLHALPGGPARGILGPQASAQQIADFNHEQGLDRPLPVQYLRYLNTLLHGDLGTSYTLNESVSSLIGQRLPKTLVLSLLSALVGLLLAIPLGMWQAVRRNRPADYVITALSFVAYSTPVYFLGLVLVLVFTQWLPWFPSQAPQGDTLGQVFAQPNALVLPVVAGAATMVAVFSRYMRAATLENLSEDYVRTARAGGSRPTAILFRHVFRNSLTSVIAMLGYYVPVLFGGAIVVEQLFNFPGMGLLFWSAAQSSDYPVLLGCVLVISVATVIGTLLADVVQRLVDPRVKAGETA
ncbi:ABC transporter permease [Streptomyces sp. NPDC094437]|uniref:ABC transporter permease n=1 Tax=Streptomyces sp. NPDC094437 TaxID=3366060 RepID=UPI0037F68F73